MVVVDMVESSGCNADCSVDCDCLGDHHNDSSRSRIFLIPPRPMGKAPIYNRINCKGLLDKVAMTVRAELCSSSPGPKLESLDISKQHMYSC